MYLNEMSSHALTLRIGAVVASMSLGSSVVEDDPSQLSPPEAALWTGERYQLALLRSGNSIWLELRGFATIGGHRSRVPLEQEHNPVRFRDFIRRFFEADTGHPVELPSLGAFPL